MVASASIFIAIVPVILMSLYVFSTSADKKLLVVMLALLPRQIQITHYISDLVHFVIVFLDMMERNKGLLGSLKEYDFFNIEKKINWGSMEIRFNDENIKNIHSLNDLENTIKNLSCGRFLIKGENGSVEKDYLAVGKGQATGNVTPAIMVRISLSTKLSRVWQKKLKTYLKELGNPLIAVGLAHLLPTPSRQLQQLPGGEGLLRYFFNKHYTVERFFITPHGGQWEPFSTSELIF